MWDTFRVFEDYSEGLIKKKKKKDCSEGVMKK